MFRSVVAALLALSLLVLTAGEALAVSGEYRGTVGIQGGYDASGPEGMWGLVYAEGKGPVRLSVNEGSVTGSYEMSGISETYVFLPDINTTGQGTWTTSGGIDHVQNQPRMGGVHTTTNTVTSSIAGGLVGGSATSTDTQTFSAFLRRLVLRCSYVTASWQPPIPPRVGELQFVSLSDGYLKAASIDNPEDIHDELSDLMDAANEWTFLAEESDDFDLLYEEGRALIDRAIGLESRLASSPGCLDPAGEFATLVTAAIHDIIDLLVGAFGAFPWLIELALRVGAIGPGSAMPQEAAALEADMRAWVEGEAERLMSDIPTDSVDFWEWKIDATIMANSATLLGMDGIPGTDLSTADFLLVFGGDL